MQIPSSSCDYKGEYEKEKKGKKRNPGRLSYITLQKQRKLEELA